MNIHSLFAEPIIINKNCPINNDKLLDQLEGLKLLQTDKKDNYISNTNYVLEKINYGKEVKNIFSDIIKKNFIDLGYDTDFRINTSWFTYIKPKTEGEFHLHTNHWWSGCYYPLQNQKKIFISFKRLNNFSIYPKVKQYNPYNSVNVDISIEEGSLILFPSYLEHKIGYNDSEKNRISLAFNINPFGKTGTIDSEYNFK